jgi:hypothetical protein
LIHWCYTEVAKLEKKVLQQPTLTALSQKAKDKLLIPWLKLDVLTKYQITLDNQLYKAMKALRDEQAWRLNSLDAIEPAGDEADADADAVVTNVADLIQIEVILERIGNQGTGVSRATYFRLKKAA